MGDIGREKRASNRKTSPEVLEAYGVKFEAKNNGAHLVVEGKYSLIDFWPGTGKFITRSGTQGRGVFNLMKLCRCL